MHGNMHNCLLLTAYLFLSLHVPYDLLTFVLSSNSMHAHAEWIMEQGLSRTCRWEFRGGGRLKHWTKMNETCTRICLSTDTCKGGQLKLWATILNVEWLYLYMRHKSQAKAIGNMMEALDSQQGQKVAELDFVIIYEYITRFMFQMGCFTWLSEYHSYHRQSIMINHLSAL